MKRPEWIALEGVDEQHEIEIAPGIALAIHRELGSETWQAILFELGAEENPVMVVPLRSRKVQAAKREAVTKVAKGLYKLVEALGRVKVAA